MIGIGIDIGGTYTDAVVYDMEKRVILASGKALTTREDLKCGIENVLKKLPAEAVKQCGLLALSTTLATNACVEGKGGRGKLILIGVEKKHFKECCRDYGIDCPEQVYLLECTLLAEENKCVEPDWELFLRDIPNLLEGCDCISIVQVFAKEHHGKYEKKAAAMLQKYMEEMEIKECPMILGYELFADLNAIKRGAGALLNARLVPLIRDFLDAVKQVFKAYGLNLPLIIVRSDGSFMNETFAKSHPVETLLCGPAASIQGAKHLTKARDALVVDMGGTTTDIAFIKDGKVKYAADGVEIGGWKTFVKGAYVETFGLGGDTAVRFNAHGKLILETYRVIPICMAASAYPELTGKLQRLAESEQTSAFCLHEALCLVKQPEEGAGYTELELALCRVLKEGPLLLQEAAGRLNKDLYNLQTGRLERDGILMRAGLTPTDIMHLKGDFQAFNKEASAYAARFAAHCTGFSVEQMCGMVYNMVVDRLYKRLYRSLITAEYPELGTRQNEEALEKLTEISLFQAKEAVRAEEAHGKEESPFTSFSLRTRAVLIGIGAPAHIFLEKAGRLLGTEVLIPPHAKVANAIGAIVGNVTASAEIEIVPVYAVLDLKCYRVIGSETLEFEDYEEAYSYAKEEGKRIAGEKAKSRGAAGILTFEIRKKREEGPLEKGSILLKEVVQVTAYGEIS